MAFDKPVSTIENPRINEWLTEVEKQMRLTLAKNLARAVAETKTFTTKGGSEGGDASVECAPFLKWCDSYQVQVITLAAQIGWSEEVESVLAGKQPRDGLKKVLAKVEDMLKLLADLVLQEQPPLRRKKLEHLIYEYVHRRTITRYPVTIKQFYSLEFSQSRIRVQKVSFQQTHIQGLLQLLLTVSWDLRA